MQIATSGIYTGAARGSFSVQPRVPLTYPYWGLKVVWLSTMFKNQQLQASYEDWHATAESVSQMTLIGSPIPADFVAAKLDALSLSSYEVSILEHALRAGILTTEKSFPKSIEEDSAQLRRATPLMGLGYRWEIDISAVDELPYPLRDLEKVRDNVERKLFRNTADLVIRWLKDIHDEIQKK